MKFLKDVTNLEKATFLEIEDYYYILLEGEYIGDAKPVCYLSVSGESPNEHIILDSPESGKYFFDPSEIEHHVYFETWEDAKIYWDIWKEV